MASVAVYERIALADALESAGPGAPTLCPPWSARDLAAHVIVRERRLEALGLALPALGNRLETARAAMADRPWAELLSLVRQRPFWFPELLDRLVNGVEFFIHTEDVRRATDGWIPRPTEPHRETAMNRALASGGRGFFRKSPVGVRLRVPDGTEREVKSQTEDGSVTLSGPATELMLYAAGRTGHARVDIEGDTDAITLFRESELRF